MRVKVSPIRESGGAHCDGARLKSVWRLKKRGRIEKPAHLQVGPCRECFVCFPMLERREMRRECL